MWRALIWLNPYGREAVRHKLKNSQKTQSVEFSQKMLRIGDFEKLSFIKSAILIFIPKEKKFASFPWKSVQINMVEWMGLNFDFFHGFQKIPCYA